VGPTAPLDETDRPVVLVEDRNPGDRGIFCERDRSGLARVNMRGALGDLEQPTVGGEGHPLPAQRDRLRTSRAHHRLGRAEPITLSERHAQGQQPIELGGRLDALGDQPRVEPRGESPERLDHGGLGLVRVDAGNQPAVDLHEVRP
jgi:hypothetical protein